MIDLVHVVSKLEVFDVVQHIVDVVLVETGRHLPVTTDARRKERRVYQVRHRHMACAQLSIDFFDTLQRIVVVIHALSVPALNAAVAGWRLPLIIH